ncbi:hypothetical protein EJ05DRAFT_491169 [Pseudovirgaria hyperparasitica]|uniref:PCI domain-containing protein n=1 Tax=Pseudovirgaria hyperparasitica TaxID=470096 RepID=A0A6A6WLD4_9PEZI|nr:uncharacterized protein EJ05DRAFT_491169 [Pseudovirgaria hyperparasitica]KAF2762983.1 hypothetical protein EJ05DRAFT_491169 [Pseudovirgaria hyperparasitica]
MSLPPWRQVQPVQTMHTAYNTVGARRGFEAPQAITHTHMASTTNSMSLSASSEPKPVPRAKMTWSQDVRDYVQRSFDTDAYIPGIEREEVEKKLKSIINNAAETDTLLTTNWAELPLPQKLIQEDRKLALARNSVVYGQGSSLTSNADRKRKSNDALSEGQDRRSPPPWRQTSNQNPLEDRLTFATQEQADRLDKRQRKLHDKSSKYQNDLERRKQRFQSGKLPWSSDGSESRRAENNPDIVPQGPVIGTCQTLEKRYLRLTSAPKPEAVRPLPVLRKTLDLLKKKWKEENNYGYVCDQFKSLRQDLTVQHIKEEFTVNVYEIHARIALEKGDMGEYNQCQTQLRALYSQNLGGNPPEFLAYRILYFIHTNNRTSMNDVLADLTATDKQQPAVAHALKVRSALALGNYHKFFQLYLDTPNMGAYLMDMFIQRERLAAMANIMKGHGSSLRIRYITEELGFESDHECAQFISDFGGDGLFTGTGDGVRVNPKLGVVLFESARAAAFRKVDIKGQI